jgi:hypothetical protein
MTGALPCTIDRLVKVHDLLKDEGVSVLHYNTNGIG